MAKRLQKELASLQKSPIPGCTITLPSESNVHLWSVHLQGAPSTPYSEGLFHLQFTFPTTYPFKPPTILFLTKIYHPNIHTDTGEICNDLIGEGWGPTLNVRWCIGELVRVMKEPDADSPLVEAIAVEFRDKNKVFEKTARKWTKEHASGGR